MKPAAPFAIALLVTLTSACGESGSPRMSVSQQDAPTSSALLLKSPSFELADASTASDEISTSSMWSERKLIRTGRLSLEVEDVEATLDEAASIAASHGGFLSDSQVVKDDEGHLSANLTLRIPSGRFDSAVSDLGRLGEVERESTATEDVTKAYLDLETRLRVSRDTEQRLRELLRQRTGDVSQILEVERELRRVIENIERMEGERRYYDRQTSVSTIYLTIYEPDAVLRPGSLSPISEAFADALRVLAQSVAILIYLVTFVVPWLVLTSLVWWLVQLLRRRRQADRQAAA
jgi:hypothetical protein